MKWFRERLALKLLGILFIVGFLPFGLLLYYSEWYGEKRLSAEAMQAQFAQMEKVCGSIGNELQRLRRQLEFLSGVAVMDDLLVKDLDRRVTILLQRYKSVFDLDITLLAIDADERIVAGTEPGRLEQRYTYREALRQSVASGRPVMIDKEHLLFYTPVYASFSRERVIGYLLAEYAVSNLKRFTLAGETVQTAIVHTGSGVAVGAPPRQSYRLSGPRGMYSDRQEIMLYEALESLPEGWYLLYRLNKAKAFAFLADLNRYLFWLLGAGIVVIALVSYWISNRIVTPLRVLAGSASAMAQSGKYDQDVPVRSADEVGKLAASFNMLLSDIRGALEALEAESRFRMQRLTQLIALFNRLLQAQSESGCLQTALTELRSVVPEHSVRFTPEGPRDDLLSLYVYDFAQEKKAYYGALEIPTKAMDDSERAFYRAIASMIAARIEQIRAFDQLHRHSEAKSTFISHMSHELRTPLHAIMTQTQYLIGYAGLGEKQMAKVGQIEASAEHLLGMINDILDLAKLESGKYRTKLETLSMADLVTLEREVVQMLLPLAEQKGIEVIDAMEAEEGETVADRRLLRQILVNLLSNAIKFTERGSVTLLLRQEGKRVTLCIRDTGCGIRPEALAHLFEAFVQEDGTGAAHKGTGLGLALSRNFARLFDAEVTLSSRGPGQGTEAAIHLLLL